MRILALTIVIAFVMFENGSQTTSAQSADNRSKDMSSLVRNAINKVESRLNIQRPSITTNRGQGLQPNPQRAPGYVRQLNLFNARQPRVERLSNPANKRLSVMSELFETSFGTNAQKTTFVSSAPVKEAIQKLMPCSSEPAIVCDPSMKFRTADGSCNNLIHPRWGMSFTPEDRWLDPDYDDGFNSPRSRSKYGGKLPSPRLISNVVMRKDVNYPLDNKNTMMLMAWGQFLDHGLTSTPTTSRDKFGNDILCCGRRIQQPECFPIEIPCNDPFFNNSCMEFLRSTPVLNDPCTVGPRQQINQLSSYLDASNVYGSDDQQMVELRLPGPKGKLRTNPVNLPPADSNTKCSLPVPTNGAFCMKAGDSRVNEVVHLGGMHVTFVRLHNWIATTLKQINPRWNGDRIFQESRKIVAALQQKITFSDYLPVILSGKYIKQFCLRSSCQGYNPHINPSIKNAFAAAVFRMGHTQVPRNEALLNSRFQTIQKFPLDQTLNNPHIVTANKGENVDKLMRFVVTTKAGKTDRFLAQELRDKLFITPDGSFDLFSLNMQRGRDHGLPPYNKWREFCGLPKAQFFHTKVLGLIHHSSTAAFKLSQVYSHPDDIDLFAGGISETLVPGGLLGPTFSCLFALQFQSLKLGDRFWWESNNRSIGFSNAQKRALKKVRLSWIICKVFGMDRIQKNVFKRAGAGNRLRKCKSLAPLNLKSWRERRKTYNRGKSNTN